MSSGQDAERASDNHLDGELDVVPPAGTKLIELKPESLLPPERKAFDTRHLIWGVGFMLALGLGTAGVLSVHSGSNAKVLVAQQQADASAQVLQNLQNEVARLKGSVDQLRTSAEASHQDESLRGLRHSVDNLRQEVDQVKAAGGNNLAQLSSKIDKVDHDPNPKLAEIVARLDKLDHDAASKTQDGAGPKIAEVQNRIDRLEKQVSSAMPTGSIAPAAHAVPMPPAAPATPTFAAQKTSAKPENASAVPVTKAAQPRPVSMAIPGWSVRDVYDGLALVEQRDGDLREVAPGEFLPGVGQIQSIERRGRSWVVMTDRGAIE